MQENVSVLIYCRDVLDLPMQLASTKVLRVLDPPCTYSPTLNITLPAGVSSAFLRDHPVPGHTTDLPKNLTLS